MDKTIMIVDDSISMREMTKFILKCEGHNVIEACDGEDALLKLNGDKIHLIICDINMPNLDGMSFIKKLRTFPSYSSIPIILLTVENDVSLKVEAKAIGVKAWMTKPFDAKKLVNLVNQFYLP